MKNLTITIECENQTKLAIASRIRHFADILESGEIDFTLSYQNVVDMTGENETIKSQMKWN